MKVLPNIDLQGVVNNLIRLILAVLRIFFRHRFYRFKPFYTELLKKSIEIFLICG